MLYSVPCSPHQLLSVALASAWGLGSRRQRIEEEEEEEDGLCWAMQRHTPVGPPALSCHLLL